MTGHRSERARWAIVMAFAINFVWARVERRLFPYREADHS